MKQGYFIFILLYLFLGISCKQLGDQKVVYLAHTLPTSHPVHKGMEVFAKEVSKQSDGKMSIAMTKVSAAAMANFAPEYKVMGVPYLFRDKEHLFSVLEGKTGEDILEAGSEYLLKGLCFYDAGSRSFYTKEKPIKTPDDLKGLKIRVMNHQMSVDMVNAMGGAATPMAYGELYTALQQGVVDGAENNPPSFVTSGHYEVCKFYTLDEHSSIPDVLIIGTKYWARLNDQERGWLRASAKISAVAQRQFWKENVEACLKKLKKEKVEIFRPEKSLFADKSKSVLEEFIKDPKMKKMVSEIRTNY